MKEPKHIDEYDYYCSSCRAVVDEQDKFCRECGAETSQLIEEPDDEQSSPIVDGNASPASAGVAIPLPEVPYRTPNFQTSLKRKPRAGLGSAAILLFVMAAFQFVNHVVSNHGQVSGTTSALPVIANVIIAIGLLRSEDTWSMSQNGYRIWAIIRCIATPVLIVIIEAPNTNAAGALLIHSPELLIAAGLLAILLGPPPSRTRVTIGILVSVIGFIGVGILIGIAST